MQTFYNAIKKEIEMVRGDSMAFNFQIAGLAGMPIVDIYFTCKDKPLDEEFYFQQSYTGGGITLQNYDEETDTGTYCVRVRPDQTKNLDPARYYYDLELVAGSDVLTLMKGRLTIDYDVTN